MKRIKLIMMIAISLTVFANVTNAQNETLCPSGYNVVQLPFMVGGCEYTAEICYMCGNVVNPATQVSVLWYKKVITDPECSNGLTNQAVLDNIYDQIRQSNFLNDVLGCTQSVPPCGTPNLKQLYLRQPLCWQKFKEQDGSIQIAVCSDGSAYCEVLYEYCWSGTELNVIANIISKSVVGTNSCPPGLEPNDPTDPDYPSVCFRLLTECDY